MCVLASLSIFCDVIWTKYTYDLGICKRFERVKVIKVSTCKILVLIIQIQAHVLERECKDLETELHEEKTQLYFGRIQKHLNGNVPPQICMHSHFILLQL